MAVPHTPFALKIFGGGKRGFPYLKILLEGALFLCHCLIVMCRLRGQIIQFGLTNRDRQWWGIQVTKPPRNPRKQLSWAIGTTRDTYDGLSDSTLFRWSTGVIARSDQVNFLWCSTSNHQATQYGSRGGKGSSTSRWCKWWWVAWRADSGVRCRRFGQIKEASIMLWGASAVSVVSMNGKGCTASGWAYNGMVMCRYWWKRWSFADMIICFIAIVLGADNFWNGRKSASIIGKRKWLIRPMKGIKSTLEVLSNILASSKWKRPQAVSS